MPLASTLSPSRGCASTDNVLVSFRSSDVGLWHETVIAVQLPHVCYLGQSGRHPLGMSISHFDPHVWSGRALQVDFAKLAVSGLASMYPAFDLEHLLRAIMDISARAFSLTDRPQRAMWVTSVRKRREDRTSISTYPLADLGR
jgi:hypothetical protein